jgi:hypothetical protein
MTGEHLPRTGVLRSRFAWNPPVPCLHLATAIIEIFPSGLWKSLRLNLPGSERQYADLQFTARTTRAHRATDEIYDNRPVISTLAVMIPFTD